MTQTVSAVIPTLGRPSLGRAVQSVLGQTRPVYEVIVVADTDEAVTLPPDDRITLLRSSFRGGPGKCRQLGIDAARGSVIALLDDDDEWYSTKLERQLQAVGGESGTHWIASSRMAVLGPGIRRRIWPRRLIKPEESVTDYLFRFTDLRFGGAALQTSTLCFPTDLARKVRWDAHVGAAHDEPTWLIRVQRAIPDLRVIQLPDVLSTYRRPGHICVARPVGLHRKLHRLGTAVPPYGVAARARRLPVYQSSQRCRFGAVAARGAAFSAVGLPPRPARSLRRRLRAPECGEDHPLFGEIGGPPMTVDQGRLTTQERRALLYGSAYRIIGTPVVAALGLANTAIIVRETGAAIFGLVSLVATITLLFPFADLGIGATVLSASARLSGPSRDPDAADVVRRSYHVLFAVAGVLVMIALGVMALDGWAALIGFSSGPDDRWAITVAACVFALTIPAGLGGRILIGIDRNPTRHAGVD